MKISGRRLNASSFKTLRQPSGIWKIVWGAWLVGLASQSVFSSAFAQDAPGGSAGLLTSETLMAPCYRPTSSGAGACRIGLASCTTDLDRLFEQVRNIVKTRIDLMYERGVDKDVFLENVESDIGKPVCASGGIPTFAIPAEVTSNHLQEGCGRTAAIRVGGSPRRPRVSASFAGEDGTRERAYTRGIYALTYACQVDQVMAEARSGAVRVSNPCKPLADDIRKLFTDQTSQAQRQARVFTNSAGLTRFFCSQGDLQREQRINEFCSAENSGTTGVFNSPELLRHRNTACLMASAGASLMAAFGNFLACETFARGAAHYADVMYGPNSPYNQELRKYFDELGSEARRSCRKRRWYLRWLRTRRCANAVLNREHQERISNFMTESIQKKYFTGDACKL